MNCLRKVVGAVLMSLPFLCVSAAMVAVEGLQFAFEVWVYVGLLAGTTIIGCELLFGGKE